MALSDFMPYGAPELIDGAEQRMARATTFATLGVALLVVTAGALATRGFTQLPDASELTRVIVLDPPPTLEEALQHAVPHVEPAGATVDPRALVRLVPDLPDPVEPVADFTRPVLPVGPGTGGDIGPAQVQHGSGPVAVVDSDPPSDAVAFVDEFPNLVRCAEPRYPDMAREAGVEGTVRVLVLVGLDGRVRRAVVAPGGSVPMLDDAALEAARSCVFTPALTNRHPVKVWVSRSYRFTLH
jgi:protein TonB